LNEATHTSKRWGLILGIVLAGLIVTIAVTSLCRSYDASYFGRYRLWAFDSHAYVEMAEQPAYFTVAPGVFAFSRRTSSIAFGYVMPYADFAL
jgi:hypothetical protein